MIVVVSKTHPSSSQFCFFCLQLFLDHSQKSILFAHVFFVLSTFFISPKNMTIILFLRQKKPAKHQQDWLCDKCELLTLRGALFVSHVKPQNLTNPPLLMMLLIQVYSLALLLFLSSCLFLFLGFLKNQFLFS